MKRACPWPAGDHSTRQWLTRSSIVFPPSFERRMKEFSPVMTTSCGSTICASAILPPPGLNGCIFRFMAADNKVPGVQALLDVELVPLGMASAMAYFDITGHRKVVGSEAQLAEIGRLVAIALSTVAPIYKVTEAGGAVALTGDEINERLFKDRSQGLEGLAIRREHLQKAIATLKEARASFGGST